VERIASGGMGEVFRARDTVLAREVAIKVLHRSLAGDQAFVDRFRTEARAAAGLSHANIVAVFDWGSVDGIYYMVMEHVRGQSMRAVLNHEGRLEPALAADVVRQTLLALEHAHRQGIVHRDVKPENILVTADGVVKVADFGLARAYAEGRQTQAGTVTGTVQYLAPEQIRGEPADPRSDLYSLGIVSYELLTGALPFTGETAMAIAYKHLSGRVPMPSATVSSIPPELDGFVASAADRDREMRPESALEMRRDLEALTPSLPAARSLASLVGTPPLAQRDDAGATSVVLLGDLTERHEIDTTTATISRVERGSGRRWRRRLGVLAVVAALAACAWGAWTYLVPHRADVPLITGLTVEAARDRLAEAGFTVRIGEGQRSERVVEGRVIRVQPEPGTSLEQGETVTVVPSLGPPPVEAPDVAGLTLERATERLTRVELGAAVAKRRFHDTIPEGSVIDQVQTGMVPADSTVELIVSKGHAPVEIPKVTGLSEREAADLLRADGFSVTIEQEFSNTIDRGSVIGVSPKTGRQAPYESEVTLTISRGPERFPLPSFIGMSKTDAEAKARSYGLEVSFFIVPNTTGSLVISQSPPPGTTVSAGDGVTLYVA
jgi:eukaryotic-like serine/threonine-protein kinase